MVNERCSVRGASRLIAALAASVALMATACGGDDGTDDPGTTEPGSAGRADPPAAEHPRDDELRINEIQVLGTHNSYHLAPHETFAERLEEELPGIVEEFDYEHEPLPVQFADQGIRQIELDIFADPDGGLYGERRAYEYAGLDRDPGIEELHEPGFKVLHVQEVDPESTCWSLVSCLEEVREWSEANPGHVPMMVLVEAKDGEIPDPFDLGFVPPIPMDDPELLDGIDAEILSVFEEEQVVTPDDVRGDHASLEEAILTDGWPTLGDARGKLMFALDNTNEIMDAYIEGHPSLEGRVMFTGGTPAGEPETAFMKINEPVENYDEIAEAVEAGYLVRTRSDADPQQRGDMEERRELALSSGAQFVSTDFPEPDPRFEGDFFVEMPGGTPARCNPISAPPECEPTDIEDPDLLSG